MLEEYSIEGIPELVGNFNIKNSFFLSKPKRKLDQFNWDSSENEKRELRSSWLMKKEDRKAM